ncbi:putative HTH-type transcriptional regulator xre [Streptococcus oralis SK304]|uniref:Putative HTH-type transcriptional regulator xre n=1 Tax=Streptococcus oralis SK304 TaxID=1161421 RepID=J4K9S5_STROR|nr:helix-turn-helix transcriptional regulator [Streptococcus oralis]EJP23281.1 putative HTH-type transcriptional regulator xre [Streptococcus oralis SK304]
MIIERLKKLRKEGKLTQKDIATFLNISQPAYQQFESGKKKMNLETMEKLADYFNVSTDYLLGKTDFPDIDLEVDIDNAIDNSVAYDGTPITDNDREIIKNFLKDYFANKK